MVVIDFVRNIVNVQLGRALKEGRIQSSVVDEIKRLLSTAEDKYGFSSFGGNPEKLADYLESRDFELLVSAFKAGGGVDVLLEILRQAEEAYKDLPRLRETLREVIQGLSEGRERIGTLSSVFEYLKKMFPDRKVYIQGDEIVVEGDVTARLRIEDGKIRVGLYKVVYVEKGDLDKLKELIANA
ncbi:hypothetical protein ACSU1N_00565 [Thermogladius sp. 4427co]|uniref:hypothetical protein n=1 Tax=Thermogladius sp. 4427co TaxID=3450718 RepID=UPI003F78F15C